MSAPSGPSAGNGSAPVYGNVSRETLKSTKGIDLLQGMIDGRYPAPPIAGLMDFGLTELAPGRAVFAGRPGKQHYNPSGTVHGGFAATLLDSAMGCAVHSLLKPGQAYTTVDMTINFVRPVFANTGRLKCEGKVIHPGSRIATSEGRVWDQNGKLVAHGSETCFIMAAVPPGTTA